MQQLEVCIFRIEKKIKNLKEKTDIMDDSDWDTLDK